MAVSDVTAIYSGTICFAQILQATRENDLSLANIEAWLLDFFFTVLLSQQHKGKVADERQNTT